MRLPTGIEAPSEFANYQRIASLGIDVLHARFVTKAYARHAHDALVIGVFEQGSVRFRYRGGLERCSRGQLMVFDPEEVHDGIPEAGGFVKRVAYIPLEVIAESIGRKRRFGTSVIRDFELWRAWSLCLAGTSSERNALAQEVIFTRLLDVTFRRWSGTSAPQRGPQTPLTDIRDRMHDEPEKGVVLAELARRAGLSRAEFVRRFSAAFGLPPHAYLVSLRLRKARKLLDRGVPIAQAALDAGFFDQAHLARHFRRAYGIAPRVYAGAARTYKTEPLA